MGQWHAEHGNRVIREFRDLDIEVVELCQPGRACEMAEKYRCHPDVAFVEPDDLVSAATTPNDPAYQSGFLWALNNTGQSGGVPGADLEAATAWDRLRFAGNIIVAVIDSGVRYAHEDLAANMWRNPGEIPGNGLDDDGNGYVDDVFGIDAITGSGDPTDDNGHGTHIAGTIGAVGQNGKGGVGVAWKVQLLAGKFLGRTGQGAYSDAIECIEDALTPWKFQTIC